MENELHVLWIEFYKTSSFNCFIRKHNDFHLDIDTLLDSFNYEYQQLRYERPKTLERPYKL
jgi:hypothetical protein